MEKVELAFWPKIYIQQECNPLGCIPSALYCTGGRLCPAVSLTETPLDKDTPRQRLSGQRTPGQGPPGQRTPWTENPLDRDPPGRNMVPETYPEKEHGTRQPDMK